MLHTSNFEAVKPIGRYQALAGNTWRSGIVVPRYETTRSRLAMVGTLGWGNLTLTDSSVRLEADGLVSFRCTARFGWCSTVLDCEECGPSLTISFYDRQNRPVADDLQLRQLNRSGNQPLEFDWMSAGRVDGVYSATKRIRVDCPDWQYWPII